VQRILRDKDGEWSMVNSEKADLSTFKPINFSTTYTPFAKDFAVYFLPQRTLRKSTQRTQRK